MIKSRRLVGTDDLCTVESMHSSRVSKFWIFFEILDWVQATQSAEETYPSTNK